MKLLIIYMSKHGTTEKAVKYLQNLLYGRNVTVVNLEENPEINLSSYTHVAIGGSIHAGHMQKEIKEFCSTRLNELLTKKVVLFLCYLDKSRVDEYFNTSFPPALVKHAFARGKFGGELIFEKMNFLQRFFMKRLSGKKNSVHELNYGAISDLAWEIRQSALTLDQNADYNYEFIPQF